MLFLLPNLLSEETSKEDVFPPRLSQIVDSLEGLIAESEKAARHYLRRFLPRERFSIMPIHLLNEHTSLKEIDHLLTPLLTGKPWGLISDAGLPCIADPGALLVQKAYEKGIAVESIPGPCSLLLALQLSGLGGQRFAFHGYLPREVPALQEALVEMEMRARKEKATQIWIEAPYRSEKVAKLTIEVLQPSTVFCIASDLTSTMQEVRTKKIQQWRKVNFSLGKTPVVFLISSVSH